MTITPITAPSQEAIQGPLDFDRFFADKLSGLHDGGNYRVFAELERQRGCFPRATRHRGDGSTHDVTVWCSNDYL
ncbi:MAG: 5-aminolevulinate synthase, partial [Roseitalea sp.]|nr:5-aminolevulinate synthase [Roseitalea sp.]MBO6600877.1 5-aminolevulinate synthase [Roseitalea sp.]MBO6612558.1 5-aminolevulinate synthase [Roseitalea sp.]MBO6665662.1 5-aminolevulinate synthase [Roseitalea sp.]MBO6927159.1 5-aminolevulinate synthase [Roseitalea sp.]